MFPEIPVEQAIHQKVPTGQWQIVDVVFPGTANTNHQIAHTLKPPTPEDVEYTVLRQANAGVVYEDRSATRTAWGPGFIILRSDVAGWKGRLLLQVLKTPMPFRPTQ